MPCSGARWLKDHSAAMKKVFPPWTAADNNLAITNPKMHALRAVMPAL